MIIAWAYNAICKNKNKKRKHRSWVDNILKKRKGQGAYQHLVRELQGDGERFQQYFRLTREQFAQVLFLVEEDLVKHSRCCHQNSGNSPTGDVIFGISHPNSHSHAAPIATWCDSFFLHRIPHAERTEKRT